MCVTNQSDEQVIGNEIDGDDEREVGRLPHRQVHYLHPALLQQYLEHGHERLSSAARFVWIYSYVMH